MNRLLVKRLIGVCVLYLLGAVVFESLRSPFNFFSGNGVTQQEIEDFGIDPETNQETGERVATEEGIRSCEDLLLCDITAVASSELSADTLEFMAKRKLVWASFLGPTVASNPPALEPQAQELYELYETPQAKAFLSVIRRVLFRVGGDHYQNLDKGGAYAFSRNSFDALTSLGLKKPGPLEQDLLALHLIYNQKHIDLWALDSSNFEQAIETLKVKWPLLDDYDVALLWSSYEAAIDDNPVHFATHNSWGEVEKKGLLDFQEAYDLPKSGELDKKTVKVLFDGRG